MEDYEIENKINKAYTKGFDDGIRHYKRKLRAFMIDEYSKTK